MKSVLAVACSLVLLSVPVVAQTVVPLTPFRSIELRDGVKAILRHGPSQRVAFIKGSSDYTRVTIASADHLVIEKCVRKCPRGYDLEVEIVTPDIARLSVTDGGTIQSRGRFPRQAEMAVTVSNGGMIDIRSMAVGSVTASVVSGGGIFATPLTTLVASVVDGGSVTYWGDARVTSSIEHGGIVVRGSAADADKPLSDLSRPSTPVPPVPPVPPIESLRHRP